MSCAKCLRSILRDTQYPNFRLLITANAAHLQSAEQKAFAQELASDPRVTINEYENEPFNYSRANNRAARLTDAEIVCFLNDDVEVISKDWLDLMVTRVMLPDVGIVGPMLYFPRETIQHAGVVLGIGGVAGHQFANLPRGNPGYFGRAKLEQDLSCVTGACMVVRREVLDALGGFDEELEIAFNDVDFCIRAREAGWRILWTPCVEMYHHESASLGKHNSPQRHKKFADEVAMMRQRWGRSSTPTRSSTSICRWQHPITHSRFRPGSPSCRSDRALRRGAVNEITGIFRRTEASRSPGSLAGRTTRVSSAPRARYPRPACAARLR